SGSRDMAFNDSIRSIPLEHGWEVIGIETTGAARYERNKGPGAHQRVHLRNILDAIMIRLVHGDHRDPRSQREKAKLLARSKRCRCRWRARRGPGDAVRRKPARRFSPVISLSFQLCIAFAKIELIINLKTARIPGLTVPRRAGLFDLRGRVRGSRNKLSEEVICALLRDFRKHGEKAIAKVRREQPGVYLRCLTLLIPREHKVQHSNPLKDLTDEQLEQAIAAIEAMLAAQAGETAKVIEGEAEVVPSLPAPARPTK